MCTGPLRSPSVHFLTKTRRFSSCLFKVRLPKAHSLPQGTFKSPAEGQHPRTLMADDCVKTFVPSIKDVGKRVCREIWRRSFCSEIFTQVHIIILNNVTRTSNTNNYGSCPSFENWLLNHKYVWTTAHVVNIWTRGSINFPSVSSCARVKRVRQTDRQTCDGYHTLVPWTTFPPDTHKDTSE